MGRKGCPAVQKGEAKRKGHASYYGEKQYACYGLIDCATDEYLPTCRECPKWDRNYEERLEKAVE